MILAAVIAALMMGFVLGLLGGGGSILAVPVLVYLLELEPKVAIATSLLVVGATSAGALIGHARAGRIDWRVGTIFALFAMVGAFGGGRAAAFVSGGLLLVAFALLMLVTSAAMLRARPQPADCTPRRGSVWKVALEGLAVGFVTGLVGAGGGFLVVPALVLLGGLDMKTAVGTSLLVIAMKSAAGFVGFAGHVEVDYAIALPFVVAAVIGSLAGARAARGIDSGRLRTVFGWFVLAMGVFVLGQQLPDALNLPVVTVWVALSGAFATIAALVVMLPAPGAAE